MVVNYNQKCEAQNCINCLLTSLTKIAVATTQRAVGQQLHELHPGRLMLCQSHASVAQNLLPNLFGHSGFNYNPCQRWYTLQSSAFNFLFPKVKIGHRFRQN